jgi:hypothetical protein
VIAPDLIQAAANSLLILKRRNAEFGPDFQKQKRLVIHNSVHPLALPV